VSLAGKSLLKTVIPVEGTKELPNSSHMLKGVIAGNVSLCFGLRMVRQKCLHARKKDLVGVWGVLRRRKRVVGVESLPGMLVVCF